MYLAAASCVDARPSVYVKHVVIARAAPVTLELEVDPPVLEPWVGVVVRVKISKEQTAQRSAEQNSMCT